MSNMAAYQQAMKAYQTATVHGFSSHDIWLQSLKFIEERLHEAKTARAAENFPEVYNVQVRITQVISMLQSSLPDLKELNQADPVYQATEFLHGMYSHITMTLMMISVKKDWAERYDSLLEIVKNVRTHLTNLELDQMPSIPPEGYSNDS